MTTASDGSTPPVGDAGQGTTDPGANAQPPGSTATPPPSTPPAPPAPKAPEAYAPFTVGEGLTLDESVQALALPIFKELDLDQAAAQKIVDAYGQITQQLDQRSNAAHATMIADWQKQGRSDPDFGGANYDQTTSEAQALIARYGDPELTKFLGDTGIGNHPGLLRMFARIGKHFSEANIIPPAGDGGAGGKKPLADLLWGAKK